mgnify:CR=1 FL=1
MPDRGTQSNNIVNSSLFSSLSTLLTIFHQALFIQSITLIEQVQDYGFHGLGITNQSQQHMNFPNHNNQVHRKHHNITL